MIKRMRQTNVDQVTFTTARAETWYELQVPEWVLTETHGNLMYAEFSDYLQQFMPIPRACFSRSNVADPTMGWTDDGAVHVFVVHRWTIYQIHKAERFGMPLRLLSNPGLFKDVVESITESCFPGMSPELSILVAEYLEDASLF